MSQINESIGRLFRQFVWNRMRHLTLIQFSFEASIGNETIFRTNELHTHTIPCYFQFRLHFKWPIRRAAISFRFSMICNVRAIASTMRKREKNNYKALEILWLFNRKFSSQNRNGVATKFVVVSSCLCPKWKNLFSTRYDRGSKEMGNWTGWSNERMRNENQQRGSRQTSASGIRISVRYQFFLLI